MTDEPTASTWHQRFRRPLVYAGCISVVTVGIAAAILARDTGNTKLPAQSYSNYCGLVRSFQSALESSDPVAGGADAGRQLSEALRLIETARDSAPNEIRGDMEAFAGAYRQVRDALVAAGSDPNAAGPDVLAPIQRPAFDSALGHITAYDKRVCKTG